MRLKADLPLHKAVLDAVIAKNPDNAEKAIRALIEGAHQDIIMDPSMF
jgi:DNA-binding FadR family transcriptional regulator